MKLHEQKWYITLRRWWLDKWTRITEERRKSIITTFSVLLNYLANALLISVPLTVLFSTFTLHNYFMFVICVWISLPLIEHYYVWFRESWKNNILP